MKTHNRPTPEVELPPGTINLVDDLVPAIRQLLAGGLSTEFQRACVRIGRFDRFSGGLKAPLVGGLRIDVNAAMKLGGPEMAMHTLLMNHVNGLRKNTFPAVLHQRNLSDGRIFIITELLRSYVTVFEKVYREHTTIRELRMILDKVFEALDTIHKVLPIPEEPLDGLPTKIEPFAGRISERLAVVIKADPDLAIIMDKPGITLGLPCPPLVRLLAHAEQIGLKYAAATNPSLIHGDPHLANIMVRRNGPHGYRVRLIDPNPEIGFSQPLYDVGKLMHWATPVGWAKAAPDRCITNFGYSATIQNWHLTADVQIPSAAAERRRQFAERRILKYAKQYTHPYNSDFSRMLALSIASAHFGMAALLSKPSENHARRFVLAHGLSQLARIND